MPCFNSEAFIKSSIESVMSQTYSNWELLIVDDCSTDGSTIIIKYFCKIDSRIKLYSTTTPSGSPAIPRNIGVDNSHGRFIAFLDSDDLWEKDKLENQIILFEDASVGIVYSNYEKISEDGISNNRIIIAPKFADYKSLLRGNVIACSTCIYDTFKSGKLYFDKQGHEDYALWLKILKKGFIAKNSNFVSTKYRVRKSSISSNKFKAIIWAFNIYKNSEELSIILSAYLTLIAITKSFNKFIK